MYSKRDATDGATQISKRPLSGPRKLKGFTRPLNTSGVTPRNGLRAAYIQAVQSTANETYRPQQASASVARMDNVRHALHAELDASGPHISQTGTGDAGHSLAFQLVRYGCEGATTGTGAVQAARPTARGQRVTYARGDVTEWYQNGPMGVEQGFDLRSRPTCAASGGVELELNVQTDLQAALVGSSDSPSIELRDEQGKPLFHYTDLSAFDADSKPVPAKMSLDGHKIVLRMDDRGARYPLHVDPLIWAQIGAAHKAVDDSTATSVADDRVGTSIAVSGDTAVVGCPNCDDDGTDAGAAFIFTRTAPGTWAQQVELRAGGTAGAHLGQAVAITDIGGGTKRAIVGAPDDQGDGTATFYKGSAATWVAETTWGPYAFGNTKFGASVAVSNDRILIGGPGYNTNDGLVSIVEPVGGLYTEVLPVVGATGLAEGLGTSVAIDGTLAVAGAPHRKNLAFTDAGGYDTFTRSGGSWALADSLMGAATGQLFGSAVAISGVNVLDAAPGDTANTGLVAADKLDATTGKYVALSTQLLIANGLAAGDMFGSAVAIDGNVAVVGAPAQKTNTGNAYVFRRNTTTGIWALDPLGAVTRTTAATTGELFGTSVAVNSTATVPFILVGAPGNGTPANSGAFYEFIQLKQNGDSCGAMGGDSECFSGFCVDGVCCNSACGRVAAGNDNVNDCQACAVAAGAIMNGTCGPARAAQVCNPKTANGCDLDALCQVGSMVCPNKLLRSAGTVCRAAAGACDLAEVCDGISGACPATDMKLSAGTICRAAAGACDLAETCDGTSVDCPATDAKQPNTFVCRPQAGLCDVAETCNGGNNCPADAISAAGTVCRTAQSECDNDELCDGATVGCPLDSTKVDGASCSAGSCQAGMCRVEAELALSMTASPTHTTLQNPATVTLTIQNNGPSPASQLQIQLASEDGATLQNASGTGFTCQAGQGVITCTGADLAAKASVTLTVTAIPPYTKNNFSVSGVVSSATYDPLTSNNAASVVVINDNPQTPGLGGGGFGCSLTPGSRTPAASGLFTLALAALGLLIRRRRTA